MGGKTTKNGTAQWKNFRDLENHWSPRCSRPYPKVDQQAIAEVLRYMAVKVLSNLGTGRLRGQDHGTQVFGIELAGEDGRIHQVTKQDSGLTPFGLRTLEVGEKYSPLVVLLSGLQLAAPAGKACCLARCVL
jgi:hypothetical protein